MSSYTTLADPGSAVVASALGNPRDFSTPAGWVAEFDPNDGEQISGLGTIGPYVLVFKPSKTWLIYDLDTGANRRIGVNVGCVAHRSAVETPYGTFFLAKDGVYRTDGTALKRVSADRVTPLIVGMPAGKRDLAAGAFWNGHYYLSIPAPRRRY
jgi:hypothetical protein